MTTTEQAAMVADLEAIAQDLAAERDRLGGERQAANPLVPPRAPGHPPAAGEAGRDAATRARRDGVAVADEPAP